MRCYENNPYVTSQPLLHVSVLTKTFSVNGADHIVLSGIDFSVKRGELICIVGRSGCGKSTLLSILAGFTAPNSGAVLLNGRPVTGPGADRCVVFQEDALFPWLTIAENVAFGLKGLLPANEAKVQRMLDLVGLSDFGAHLPREISGGMKQRVAVARVLIMQPEILLMDEPFASLDAQTRNDMQNLLLQLWDNHAHTILFVTHDVQEAVKLCDRVLFMNQGRIQNEIVINLPRPRPIDDRFLKTCREISVALKS